MEGWQNEGAKAGIQSSIYICTTNKINYGKYNKNEN